VLPGERDLEGILPLEAVSFRLEEVAEEEMSEQL